MNLCPFPTHSHAATLQPSQASPSSEMKGRPASPHPTPAAHSQTDRRSHTKTQDTVTRIKYTQSHRRPKRHTQNQTHIYTQLQTHTNTPTHIQTLTQQQIHTLIQAHAEQPVEAAAWIPLLAYRPGNNIQNCLVQALTGVVQLVGCRLTKQRVTGLIPSQRTCLGFGSGPQWGRR